MFQGDSPIKFFTKGVKLLGVGRGGSWVSDLTSFKQLCYTDFSKVTTIKTGMFHKTLNCLTFLIKLNATATHQTIDKEGKVMETLSIFCCHHLLFGAEYASNLVATRFLW